MIKKIIVGAFFLSVFIGRAEASFEIYSRWENGNQTVHLVGDGHKDSDSTNQAMKEQQNVIVEAAKEKGSLVVVEDLDQAKLESALQLHDAQISQAVLNDFRELQISIAEKTSTNPLQHLTHKCTSENIKCENIEFRVKKYQTTGNFVTCDFDYPEVYSEVTEFFEPTHPKLLQSLISVLKKERPNDVDEYIVNNALIEGRVIKAILSNQDVKHIYVFIGRGHIPHIENVLPSIGFSNSLQKCIASTADLKNLVSFRQHFN